MTDSPIPKSFVLLHNPTDGKAEVVYIGSDTKEALIRLLVFGSRCYCDLSKVSMVQEDE